MRIVAADVGGTKTHAALFEGAPGTFVETATLRVPSPAYPGLEPILAALLADHPGPIDAVGVGVAGPVIEGVCETTNLPWIVDHASIAAAAGAPRAAVINDFAASALGLAELRPEDLHPLATGAADPHAPVAVLGAGTGLGEAILLRGEGLLPRILPTEGGHVDWAPRDDLDVELWRFLHARYGHVSAERVLSGGGLVDLYTFLVETGLAPGSAAVDARTGAGEDPAAVIGQLGVEGRDPACRFAVERFVAAYGAEAGNLALKCLPYGGLFVAGGIGPKLAPILTRGDFMRAFLDKGRMRDAIERVPVHLVMAPHVGLLGARRAAVAAIDPSAAAAPGAK